jgi:propanol-preferring alcohol dehydrogenase
MKAALLEADGSVRVGDYPTPAADGAAIVRVRAAGVCGTELHFLDGLLKPNAYPFILGHEIAGVVEDVPPGERRVRAGDRVTVYNLIACGACRQCVAGRENLCDTVVGQLGFNADGGFAEFVRVPAGNLVPIPESVPFEAAAVLACSGMAAVHGVRAAGVTFGMTAVVNGVGGVGLMVIQVARLAGADVIAVGDTDEKLALARKVGATATIRAGNEQEYEQLPGRVREATGGSGADAFFELVGTTASMAGGFGSLGKAGVFTVIGYTGQDLTVNPVLLLINEQRLVTCVAATRRDLEDAVQLAGAGKLQTTIQGRLALDQVHEALRGLRERRVLGRNVLTFS